MTRPLTTAKMTEYKNHVCYNEKELDIFISCSECHRIWFEKTMELIKNRKGLGYKEYATKDIREINSYDDVNNDVS